MDLYSFQIITLGTEGANGHTPWLQYLTALLTPLVAALGIWIAFHQWKTARMKLKLDLFDKRVVVYEAVQRAVKHAVINDHFTDEMLADYIQGIAGTRWLYDDEMKFFLVEIVEQLCFLRPFSEFPDHAPGEVKDEFERREDEALEKISEYWDVLDEKFAPFLSLGH